MNEKSEQSVLLYKKQKLNILHFFRLPLISDDEFSLLVDEAAQKAISDDNHDILFHLSEILFNLKKH